MNIAVVLLFGLMLGAPVVPASLVVGGIIAENQHQTVVVEAATSAEPPTVVMAGNQNGG